MDLNYFCTSQPVDLKTEKEAISLRQARWAAACNLNIDYKIQSIAEYLGADPAAPEYTSIHGDKRKFKTGEIEVFWDGYGHFTTVDVGKKRVFSSHQCECFIIPGEWLKALLEFHPESLEKKCMKVSRDVADRFESALRYLQ